MVELTQTTSALKIEQVEVDLRNQIIHMTLGLDSSVL
jgi:hypothetical protein